MRYLALQLMSETPDSPSGVNHQVVDIVRFRQCVAAIALVSGALTLIGLFSGADLLTRWLPSSHSMNPITAVMLGLGGATLLLPERGQSRAVPLLASLMILAGGGKIVQFALGQPLGIDQLIARAVSSSSTAVPDAIAPNTALVLVLFGCALALGHAQRPARAIAAQSLSAIGTTIAVLALIGFTLGAATINQFTFNRMAVNTAVGLSALGLGIMALTPRHGVMQLLLHAGPVGSLARRALPICLVIPPLLGIVRLWVQEAYGISTGDGVVIMIAGNILLSLALLWGCLILLLRSDGELRAFALSIARSDEQYRVAERISQTCHWQFSIARKSLFWSREFRPTLRLAGDARPTLRAMLDLVHPDDSPGFRQLVRDALRSGSEWNRQLRIRHPDGTEQHIRSHGRCTRDAHGNLKSVFGVIAEVTELELARRSAELASHAQAAFLANMSHEIRTPLNGVMGFIDLLLNSKLDKIQRRYLSLVSESAQSLLKLLNDILDLSKVEAGQIDIAPQPTDLRRTIRHAVRLMAPAAEQKKVKLSVAIDAGFPAGIMVDAARYRQILLNVLGNALKFTEKGSVSVRLKQRSDNGVELMQTIVKDSGVGIPGERQKQVFQPFVQADTSTSRRFGGSGLGLSISRQLAERMGGSIDLVSAVGAGTTVTLTLPLEIAVADRVEGHELPAALVNGGDEGFGALVAQGPTQPALSILLVEDVALNRELVGAMLKRLGHRVDFAKNGVEAVDMARRLAAEPDAWDMILMDIQMPELNGWEATAQIRAQGGAAELIPIVALSANAYAAEIQQSRDCGMDDHAVKPVPFKELHRIVERWGRGARSPGNDSQAIRAASA